MAQQLRCCSHLLCVRLPGTKRGHGQSESLPRTPCHIWCRHRTVVSSAAGRGLRCGAEWATPRERSWCRDPVLKGRPSDTEWRTWGVQGSGWGAECHRASALPVDRISQACGQCAKILQKTQVNDYILKIQKRKIKGRDCLQIILILILLHFQLCLTYLSLWASLSCQLSEWPHTHHRYMPGEKGEQQFWNVGEKKNLLLTNVFSFSFKIRGSKTT